MSAKDEKLLMSMLKDGETVVKIYSGVLGSRMVQGYGKQVEKVSNGIFAITSERAIFCSDGVFSTNFEDLPLDHINAVQIHSGFMNSNMVLESKTMNSMKLVSMMKDKMFEVKKLIGK